MNLCSDGHDEVCYEGRICPVCEVLNEKDQLESKIKELEAEYEALSTEHNELKEGLYFP